MLRGHEAAIRSLASEAVLVEAVKEQNQRGPIAGMDKVAWRRQRRRSDLIKGFQTSPAGARLTEFVRTSRGDYTEAFLSARQGEKVAFFEKTSSYNHTGSAKFDSPMRDGKAWYGKPEFDESSQIYQVQVSVPVEHEGERLGVLVVGVALGSDATSEGQP